MNFENCTLNEAKKQLVFFLFFRSQLDKNDIYFKLCSQQINEIITHNPKIKELDILNLQIKLNNFIKSI
jgi:hypothetical protein